ncbi:hypothetical protein V1505DRAFT_388898 [Lipomyces doorenjongii]
MDVVSGDHNPQSASRSQAKKTVDITGPTAKRKAVNYDPATRVMREINTMPESSPISDKADVHSKWALSNYNKAFTLLNDNPVEQRLDVQLPFEKFLQLDAAFSELKSVQVFQLSVSNSQSGKMTEEDNNFRCS